MSAGYGVVRSWTTVHRASEGVETPFVLALVETDDGLVLAKSEKAPARGQMVMLGTQENGAPRFTRI